MARRLFSRSVVCRFTHAAVFVVLAALLMVPRLSAQTESATILGRVTDPTGAVLKGVEVEIRNIDTNVATTSSTNAEGLYAIHSLPPGRYIVSVHKQGFKAVSLTGLNLNVQDNLVRNFTLQIGAVSESITVNAESAKINTTDATVSTVIDRNFAENLPMNGRSFQSLIQLTPGVVTVPSNGADGGQFSVNGQRAESNYWMVDGVSANIGVTSGNFPGNGFGGTLGSFSAQGGTNSLVSVDDMQEFRIQTSTYAPEFGRTPGGQISIVSRSGTNQLHGTVFDYLRNDGLDASDWFANNNHLPKPRERQNDFGGTLGGPIFKNKTFFFFSYEGQRLELPQVAETTVPDLNARQSATPALQPFLNAYPFDPKQPDLGNGISQFNASFANRSSLDAYSLRVDHNLSSRISIFGRYNYSPTSLTGRGAGAPLSEVSSSKITTQTATVGATWEILPTLIDDLRFNYSRVSASSSNSLDSFGGAVPLASLPLQSPFNQQNSEFGFSINALKSGLFLPGRNAANLQQQINIVDIVPLTRGSHSLKFGIDYRRLSPTLSPPLQVQESFFGDMAAAEVGTPLDSIVVAERGVSVLLRNVGVFAQDTWRVVPRLTLTYGLRWDLDVAPVSLNGPNIVAVTGYSLSDFSRLAIAPEGTAPFKTRYGNFAPRAGLAYQLHQHQGSETVLRGGFGVFYDLIGSTVGTSVLGGTPPFGAFKLVLSPSFPLDSTDSASPAIPNGGSISQLFAFNPDLKSPYTLQWNIALEQALGKQQTLSASYVGASGRRLLQTTAVSAPPTNPNIGIGDFVDNTASSSYDALQVQFERRLSHGVQALASYAWAHSIDDGSASSGQVLGNEGLPGSSNANRASSDFDIRHTFSAGLTFAVPGFSSNMFAKAIFGGWSLQSLVWARSAPPVDISDNIVFSGFNGVFAAVRPDIVPGQPLYLFGTNCASVMQALGSLAPGQGCPGGKALNPNAFTDPPFDPVTFAPLRQGNVPRNFLRGFGATQWDFAVHRDFPIRESLKLQFRAEMFNVLNHPNFGQPNGTFLSPAFGGSGAFGLSSETLNHFLDGGGGPSSVGQGAFSSLYQLGGPRSIQFALKLLF